MKAKAIQFEMYIIRKTYLQCIASPAEPGWPCIVWRITACSVYLKQKQHLQVNVLLAWADPTHAQRPQRPSTKCAHVLASRGLPAAAPHAPRRPSHQDTVLVLLRSPAASTRAPLRAGRCAPRHGTRRSMAVPPPAAPSPRPAAALMVCGQTLALALARPLATWPRLLLAQELLLMLVLPRCLQHGVRVQGRAHYDAQACGTNRHNPTK